MVRVRFAPSPTGSLHVGNALTATINRDFGGTMLLRIDDTDPKRNVPGGEEAIIRDLEWLGIRWDDGPLRASDRRDRHLEAAIRLGVDRFDGLTLVREDGTPTYHLASVVDDIDFAITHVIRGSDHRPNEVPHRRLHEALGTTPPMYVHHGLILAPAGGKLSKRDPYSSLEDLRQAGIPAEAVRAYLRELGLPRHDVRLDLKRLRRLAIQAIGRLDDGELAERAGAPVALAAALRGARDLKEASEFARIVLEPEPASVPPAARPTLERLRELLAAADRALGEAPAKEIVRELKAIGGDLRAVRIALTGRARGPELWTVLAALPRDEVLRRIDAQL